MTYTWCVIHFISCTLLTNRLLLLPIDCLALPNNNQLFSLSNRLILNWLKPIDCHFFQLIASIPIDCLAFPIDCLVTLSPIDCLFLPIDVTSKNMSTSLAWVMLHGTSIAYKYKLQKNHFTIWEIEISHSLYITHIYIDIHI